MTATQARVAVIGAGMAGAACARRLANAGAHVQLFEKSGRPGGRLATRRLRWVDEFGLAHAAEVDHGAPGFSAPSAGFATFIDGAVQDGCVRRWKPALATTGFMPLDGFDSWVPVPDMPALCRHLVGTLPVAFERTVDAVRRDEQGWSLAWLGETIATGFTHVVLAMPPLQAVKLLAPHRRDWAQLALRRRMLPCWTLIAIAEQGIDPPPWQVAWPMGGPLAWVVRNDLKPGRAPTGGDMHWVAHASSAWSETQLETAPETVQEALLAALEAELGHTPRWRLVQVHRWRYASVARPETRALQPFWLDPAIGLGVCGDYLGGAGVEGAWTSGDALGGRIAQGQPHPTPACPDPIDLTHRSLS